jgi:dienelactone hydrolase
MHKPRRLEWSLIASLTLSLAMISVAFAANPVEVTFPGADGVTLQGFVYAPAGSGPFPAVVAMHGCSGLTDKNGQPSQRHADWGTRLAAQGFLVLFPDSYGSRGLGPQCKISDRDISPAKERPLDAKAALAYLVVRSDVKADAVSLMGWSNGGSTTSTRSNPSGRRRTASRTLPKPSPFIRVAVIRSRPANGSPACPC